MPTIHTQKRLHCSHCYGLIITRCRGLPSATHKGTTTMNYETKIIAKPIVQEMIKALRSSGLKVKKVDGGYVCKAISPDQKEP